jgi:hypothetical protein
MCNKNIELKYIFEKLKYRLENIPLENKQERSNVKRKITNTHKLISKFIITTILNNISQDVLKYIFDKMDNKSIRNLYYTNKQFRARVKSEYRILVFDLYNKNIKNYPIKSGFKYSKKEYLLPTYIYIFPRDIDYKILLISLYLFNLEKKNTTTILINTKLKHIYPWLVVISRLVRFILCKFPHIIYYINSKDSDILYEHMNNQIHLMIDTVKKNKYGTFNYNKIILNILRDTKINFKIIKIFRECLTHVQNPKHRNSIYNKIYEEYTKVYIKPIYLNRAQSIAYFKLL